MAVLTQHDKDLLHHLPGDPFDSQVIAGIVHTAIDTDATPDKPFNCQGCERACNSAYCSDCHYAITGVRAY